MKFTGIFKRARPCVPSPPTAAELIAAAVKESGLSKARPEDIEFYQAAFLEGALNWKDVRKRGTPLTAHEKKVFGISFRGILTREFVDTLNDKGLLDPVDAGHHICAPAANRIVTVRQLQQFSAAGIEIVRLRASVASAGPCPHAAALGDRRIPIDRAQPVPFDACLHPDQCACMYQAWIKGL